MNERELFHEDGTSSEIWYCTECRRLATTRDVAAACCKPRICDECEEETGAIYWVKCPKHRRAAELSRVERRWAEARAVQGYDGPIWIDDHDAFLFGGDVEEWAAENDIDDLASLRIYACDEVRARTDAQDVIEHALDGHHEDAHDHAGPAEDLQALLDGWWDRYPVVSWEPDYTRKVLYPFHKTGGAA